MWLFSLLKLLYMFCVTFLPVILDTGLQVWNGIEINSIDFERTVEWKGGIPCPLRENGSLCRTDEFACDDGRTCLPWDKICDGIRDCPPSDVGLEAWLNQGKDEDPEDLWHPLDTSSWDAFYWVVVDEAYEESDTIEDVVNLLPCTRPQKPVCTENRFLLEPIPGFHRSRRQAQVWALEAELISGAKISINFETIVTLALLQLPAVCLAVYGISRAMNQPRIRDKFTDSLLALTVIFLPFCLTELFALLEFEFAQGWVTFVLNKVKFGCQKALDLICGKCSDKAVATFDLLKFLPNKDPEGKDRALSVEAAKLVAGSCLQLVFQAVLLGGFTPWKDFKVSQAISIISSALMITKIAVDIVIFQRANPKPEPTEENKTMKERIRELAVELVDTLKKFLVGLPLLPSSLVFNTGTLILTIIVMEWVSAVYIVLVLLLNMIMSFLNPHSIVAAVEKKLELTYKFSKLDEEREAKKVRDTRIVRGLFITWANLFILLRPVENMSYYKITHVGLLQPIRFLVNMATLFILVGLTWSPPHTHTQVQEISLIVSFCAVFAAGLVNMLELFCYFFFGNHFCLSKPPTQNDNIEMQGMETEKVKSDLESTTTSKDEKKSLLSEILSSVKDETTNEEAYHNETTNISSGEVKREKTVKGADYTEFTDKEEEAGSKETGNISAKASNALETSMSDPTEMRPYVGRLITQVFNNNDIVVPNSELTKDEVNDKIMNIQEKGIVQ